MDIKNIITNAEKHHYYFVQKSKVLELSSSNSSQKAKDITLEYIKSNLHILKDQYVVYIQLKKIPNKNLKADKYSALNMIGGPIVIVIRVYKINKKSKLVMDSREDRNTQVYITQKYLIKNLEIKNKDIQKIARYTMNRLINTGLMSVNTIENLK